MRGASPNVFVLRGLFQAFEWVVAGGVAVQGFFGNVEFLGLRSMVELVVLWAVAAAMIFGDSRATLLRVVYGGANSAARRHMDIEIAVVAENRMFRVTIGAGVIGADGGVFGQKCRSGVIVETAVQVTGKFFVRQGVAF